MIGAADFLKKNLYQSSVVEKKAIEQSAPLLLNALKGVSTLLCQITLRCVLGTGFLNCFFLQIVDAMRPRFQKMNEAVERIRNEVQEAYNTAGQTFMRKDVDATKHYNICCTFENLTTNPNFPNVSSKRKTNTHAWHFRSARLTVFSKLVLKKQVGRKKCQNFWFS